MKKISQISILLSSVLMMFSATDVFANPAQLPSGWHVPSWAQSPTGVPEIDAMGTLPALVILGGIIALIAERKRNK